jgi:hypothetical protein
MLQVIDCLDRHLLIIWCMKLCPSKGPLFTVRESQNSPELLTIFVFTHVLRNMYDLIIIHGFENVIAENLLLVIQEQFTAYCKCTEAAKLFRFLLSPYSLVGTCNSVQNCTFRDCTGSFHILL